MTNHIPYPTRQSEAEVQAQALAGIRYAIEAACYYGNRPENCTVRAQVRALPLPGRTRGARLDIVIFDDQEKPVIIVETKRAPLPAKNPHAQHEARRKHEQRSRYEAYGLPVVIIQGTKEIPKAIEKILSILSKKDRKPAKTRPKTNENSPKSEPKPDQK